MVDTPKQNNDEERKDAVKDNPLEKQPKRPCRRRSKFRLGKNSNNSARKNNTLVDSKGNDDHMDPVMEQDEPADGEHSTELLSDHDNAESKAHQPVSGEENNPDDDAHIIPERHLEQENLHRRLIATVRILKKQKQRLKAAQNTLNRRWNKVLDTEEKYGSNRHTKSYPKRKLLPEFDDEALEPTQLENKTANQPDRPPRGCDRAANDDVYKSAHDLREDLHKKAGLTRSIYGPRKRVPAQNHHRPNDYTDRIIVQNQNQTIQLSETPNTKAPHTPYASQTK